MPRRQHDAERFEQAEEVTVQVVIGRLVGGVASFSSLPRPDERLAVTFQNGCSDSIELCEQTTPELVDRGKARIGDDAERRVGANDERADVRASQQAEATGRSMRP